MADSQTDPIVLFVDDDSIHCVQQSTGDKLWSQKLRGWFSGEIESVAISGDHVLACISLFAVCLDINTGEELWRTELGTGPRRSILTKELAVCNRYVKSD